MYFDASEDAGDEISVWNCCGRIECTCYEDYQSERSISPVPFRGNRNRRVPFYGDDADNHRIPRHPKYQYPKGHPLHIPRNMAIPITVEELLEIYQSTLIVKNVVANQPIRTGGSKCDEFCDIENHHFHNYCTRCKKNLYPRTVAHECTWGYGTGGNIHPDMNPVYLVNTPWWSEPEVVYRRNQQCYNEEFRAEYSIYDGTMSDISNRANFFNNDYYINQLRYELQPEARSLLD